MYSSFGGSSYIMQNGLGKTRNIHNVEIQIQHLHHIFQEITQDIKYTNKNKSEFHYLCLH